MTGPCFMATTRVPFSGAGKRPEHAFDRVIGKRPGARGKT
jgi:hypothetical protein